MKNRCELTDRWSRDRTQRARTKPESIIRNHFFSLETHNSNVLAIFFTPLLSPLSSLLSPPSSLLIQRSAAARAVVGDRMNDLGAAVPAHGVERLAAAGAEAIARIARDAAAEAARYSAERERWDPIGVTFDRLWQRWHLFPVDSMRDWLSWDSAVMPQSIMAWLQLRRGSVTVAMRFKLFPSAGRL